MINKEEILARYEFKEFVSENVANRGNVKKKNEIEKLASGKTEVYQSYYNFDESLNAHIKKNKSVRNYQEAVAADNLIIDIDCDGYLEEAQRITKELVKHFEEKYKLTGIKVYFSGNKGFHIEIPSYLFGEFTPSNEIHKRHKAIVKEMTSTIIDKEKEFEKSIGKLILDTSIYKKTGLIRVANTKNGKSGLFKIPITTEELMTYSVEQIKELAKEPRVLNYSFEKKTNKELAYLEMTYRMQNPDNIITTEPINYAGKDVDYSRSDFEDTKLKIVYDNCNWLQQKNKSDSFNNDDRIQLAQLLLSFEDGRNRLHTLFKRQDNYDYNRTEYHLGIMERDGYKPPRCEKLCTKSICPSMKVWGKESPIAFVYANQLKGFIETKVADEFIKRNKNTIYSDKEFAFYRYESGCYTQLTENEMLSLINRFMSIKVTKSKITAQMSKNVFNRLKMSDEILFTGEFNKSLTKINILNGLFNLEAGRIEPHNAEFYSSIQLGFEYNKDAKAPKFLKYLDEIFEGDKDKINYMLKLMCYFLIPDYSFQKIFIFYGKGRNGKSVLASIITELLGESNVTGLSMTQLNKDSFAPYNLKDKLLNICSEINTKDAELDVLKRLSGNDTITSDRKYKDHATFINRARLLFLANSIPRFREVNTAVKERFVLINFPRSFKNEEVNTNLLTELKEELPGIFNLIVAKYSSIVRGGGFYIPMVDSVEKEQSILLSQISTVNEFVEENCSLTPEGEVLLKNLYSEYEGFCRDYNYKAYGYRGFKSVLESNEKLTLTRKNLGLVVKGIRLGKESQIMFD